MHSLLFPLIFAAGLSSCRLFETPAIPPEPLHIHVLSVGQGLSVLLEQNGKFALFDTGPGGAGLEDTLRNRGIDTLEWIAFSHSHLDHTGGFFDLAAPIRQKKLHIRQIYYSAGENRTLYGDSALRQAQNSGIRTGERRQFDTLAWAAPHQFKILYPPPYENTNENAASLVLQISNGEYSALLTADLETPGEKSLLATFPSLKTDLLQVGHHGSNTGTSFAFLSKIQPGEAVISAGKRNPHGHPAPEVLQKLSLILGDTSKISRTDTEGTVSFTLSPAGLWKRKQ
ncbi:MAG: MBL fold metallo-hydrolase [Fibrobacter sp.]|jgi:competence protein ComEC|nr:MBL fold metallo-hydrolase [Fibrobacter sp.]